MLDSIASILGAQETTSTSTAAKTKNLGRDDFLKMLMAQLSHQDPLNPMDSSQFSSQLAQFSSLEQLLDINTNLEAIKTIQNGSGSFAALDLIGKEIVAAGDALSLAEGKTAAGGFTLASDADCSVLITDENGSLVRKIAMGSLGAGEHSFQWDGRNEAGTLMTPGTYGFGITAKNKSNQAVSVSTQITGQVTSIKLGASSPTVYVGKIPILLENVQDVRVAEVSQETSS